MLLESELKNGGTKYNYLEVPGREPPRQGPLNEKNCLASFEDEFTCMLLQQIVCARSFHTGFKQK